MSALARGLRYASVVMFVALGGAISSVWGQSLSQSLAYLEAPRYQQEIFLPYVAEQDRHDQIVLHMNELEAGLDVDQVTALIGAPDEITALFVTGERTEELHGFQYVYLLSRSRADEWGRAYDEQYIHVNFNLAGQIVSAEGFGIPTFHEVIRELGLGFEFTMGLHEIVKVNNLLIRLDLVHGSGLQSGAESAQDNSDSESEAILALSLPDRADNLKLIIGTDRQTGESSKIYGTFRITLLSIPASDRVSLIVE